MRRSTTEPAGSRAETAAVVAVLLLFVALGVWYSLVVPPFEKPDEVYHYAFARHLAQGNPLPVQTTQANGPWLHEGTQAPLYYFLVGRLTAAIDQSDFDRLTVQNPQANLGDPLLPGNKNFMLYSARPWPLRGANLAVHVGRWFSLALGCLTLILVYLTARRAFPSRSPLPVLSVLLVAAIPQVAFIQSSVSNDNMITVTAMAVIYWLVRLIARDKSQAVGWWEWVVLGILLGLAALSKLQGLVLLAPAGITILWLAWQRRAWRLLFAAVLLVALPAVAVAGWWYWRNYTLYGEWLAANRLLTITGLRTTPRTWKGFVGEMNGLRYSFWALFGWFNIILPGWIYKLLDGLTLLALAGLAVAAIRGWWAHGRAWSERPTVRVQLFLALWAAILMTFMVYWSTFATSSQGRLLFPMLSAFAVLMTAGLSVWTWWLPRRWGASLLASLPAGLLALSLVSLIVVLPAAYHAPAPLDALPQGTREVHLTFDGQVELVGIDLPDARVRLGESAPVTLYLRATRKLTTDLLVFVQILDENGQAIGNVTTHPGWGRRPTSLWEPERIYADDYQVRVTGPVDERSPLRATVYVGFALPDQAAPLQAAPVQATLLTARTADGQPDRGMVGTVDVAPVSPPDLAENGLTPVEVSFDGGIRLIGRRLPMMMIPGAELPVTLLWEAEGAPGGDYTAFVHLLDADGVRVAGFDEPPAAGRFPTRAWQAGDRSLSSFRLPLPADLPPGTYFLWAGLYPSESQGQVRLGITRSSLTVRDQSVLLGTVAAP